MFSTYTCMNGMYNERIQVRKKDCAQVWKGHEYVQ